MWKMITGQAVYQLIVTFVLYFAGYEILGYDRNDDERVKELATMVFNTFVWMQIFNEFNNRRLDNKFNIFEGIHRNFWFIGINCIMVGGQIMIIFVGGAAFGITKINGTQWAICLLCALPCIIWAILIRLFPDEWFAVFFNGVVKGAAFILNPVIDALHFIFHPLAQGWRAIMAPTKRAMKRFLARFRKDKSEQDKNGKGPADEESQVSTPITPPTNLPPITLTAPN